MIGRKFTTSSSKGWLILARWVLGDAGGDVRGDSALQETERERERERRCRGHLAFSRLTGKIVTEH